VFKSAKMAAAGLHASASAAAAARGEGDASSEAALDERDSTSDVQLSEEYRRALQALPRVDAAGQARALSQLAASPAVRAWLWAVCIVKVRAQTAGRE
jgi:hypothetical protein